MAVSCMAVCFFASVVLLETLLSDHKTLDQAARTATTDLMPWVGAAAIWLASGVALVVAFIVLIARQLPKEPGQ